MRKPRIRDGSRHVSAIAQTALSRYRLPVIRRRLLAHTHNITYRLFLARGKSAVLKITSADRCSLDELRSEMQWIDGLSKGTGLLVPKPLRNRDDELITTIALGGLTWHCRVMSWVPGRRLWHSIKPSHFGQLGELIASLHEHAVTFRPPRGFVRPRWEQEFEKRFADLRVAVKQGRLSRKRLRFFQAARDRALRAAKRLGRSRDVYGLIHADLGYANHLFHRSRAGAIDFEACGYGWFLHDLVEPLVFMQHVKRFARFRERLLEGYRRIRPLPRGTEEHLDDFIDFSALTTVGYIAGEPTRRRDLGWMSRYLEKVLRPPARSQHRRRRT